MTDFPAFLRTRSRRVLPADHRTEENLANESFAGESTADVDFKRLRKIQEIKREERRNKEILPTLVKLKVQLKKLSTNKQFYDLRQKLFKSVLEDDDKATLQCIETVNAKIPFSDAVMTNPRNNENVLNYALSNNLFEKASLLIEKGDEILLQHAFSVGSTTKTALLQVTEFNKIDLADKILRRVSDVQKAMTATTKIEMSDQRPRELACLHLAAYHGFKDLVRLYLDLGKPYGISVNFINKTKDTTLMLATKCGHVDTVEFLMSSGADPNKGNYTGSTALYWAIRFEYTDIVRLLLKSTQTKVNKERKLGLVAPIVLASAYGNYEIVKLLLQHGANPNHVIAGGQTPLHHACKEGHAKVVRKLLKRKADSTAHDEKGDTALLLAGRFGHTDIVRILLNHGDDPTHRNNLGHDLWYYAIISNGLSLLKTVLEYSAAQSECECQVSTDIFVRPHLFTAASHGQIEKIKCFLKAGYDPNDRDSNENTFLHYATSFNQSEVIQAFHKYVSVDAQNKMGETCLHISVKAGFVQCTRTLLEANASTNIPNKRGENILHIAAMSKQTTPEFAEMIVDHTIKTNDWESLNATDKFGNNALHIAAKFAVPVVIWEFRYLRFKDLNKDGNTPLHEAVRSGEGSDGLEILLDIFEVMNCDGNVNQQNLKEETVMHLAALEGYHNTMRRLISLKADLEAKDLDGNTVLHKLIYELTDDPNNSSRYLRSFEVIVEQSTLWWSVKKNLKLNDLDKIMTDRLHRQAMVYLMTKVKNNRNESPLGVACKLGVFEILSRYLMMKNVTFFKKEDGVWFDVTNIMPMSSKKISAKYLNISFNELKTKPSMMENLLFGTNKENISRILDIPPMKEIEKIYNKINRRTFIIVVLLHITYMELFSYAGIEISKEFRHNPINITTSSSAYVIAYTVLPVEPLILVVYCTYHFNSANFYSNLINKVEMFYFVYMVSSFSFLTIAWLVLITKQDRDQDYVQACCLLTGWTNTIFFATGFKDINYFWRMICKMLDVVYRFFAVYICVLFAFAFALHTLFQISNSIAETYPNVADTVFLIFNTMLGMGELFDDNFESGMRTAGRTAWFAKVVYVIYLILATIVLLNMLIAMMNDSYSQTRHDRKYHWRVNSLLNGIRIARLFPRLPKLYSIIKHNIPGEDETSDDEKDYLKLKLKDNYETCGQMIEPIDVQIKDQMKENFVEINSRMTKTEQQLKTIANNLDQLVSLVQKGLNTDPSSTTTPVEDFSTV